MSAARSSALASGCTTPAREERRGRLVRLVVVLELLLLDVHRAAQHDRAALELRQVERLAHDFVRLVGRLRGGRNRFRRPSANRDWSSRWCSPGPWSGASPQKATTGDSARAAVTNAVASCVTPGPQVAVATPGVCVVARTAVGHARAPRLRGAPRGSSRRACRARTSSTCCRRPSCRRVFRAFGLECLGQSFVDLHRCCSSLLGPMPGSHLKKQ